MHGRGEEKEGGRVTWPSSPSLSPLRQRTNGEWVYYSPPPLLSSLSLLRPPVYAKPALFLRPLNIGGFGCSSSLFERTEGLDKDLLDVNIDLEMRLYTG